MRKVFYTVILLAFSTASISQKVDSIQPIALKNFSSGTYSHYKFYDFNTRMSIQLDLDYQGEKPSEEWEKQKDQVKVLLKNGSNGFVEEIVVGDTKFKMSGVRNDAFNVYLPTGTHYGKGTDLNRTDVLVYYKKGLYHLMRSDSEYKLLNFYGENPILSEDLSRPFSAHNKYITKIHGLMEKELEKRVQPKVDAFSKAGCSSSKPAVNESSENLIEMSFSHAINIHKKGRRFFGIVWNKKTGEHRIYNPTNIFDESYNFKSLEFVKISDEALAPFLCEKGDVMFKAQTKANSKGNPFSYNFVVWNTYTGVVGMFEFINHTGRFSRIYPKHFPNDMLANSVSQKGDGRIIVDFETDFRQGHSLSTMDLISINTATGQGRKVDVRSVFPDYDPDIDGELLADFDIGLFPSYTDFSDCYSGLFYTAKTLKYYFVKTKSRESAKSFNNNEDIEIKRFNLKDLYKEGHEYKLLHVQTYQQCQNYNMKPFVIVADLTSKKIKFGDIGVINNIAENQEENQIRIFDNKISFHDALFSGNNGEMGVDLSFDAQLQEYVLVVYNKKTGHFKIKAFDRKMPSNYVWVDESWDSRRKKREHLIEKAKFDSKSALTFNESISRSIACNLLEDKYVKGASADLLTVSGSSDKYASAPEVSQSDCDARKGNLKEPEASTSSSSSGPSVEVEIRYKGEYGDVNPDLYLFYTNPDGEEDNESIPVSNWETLFVQPNSKIYYSVGNSGQGKRSVLLTAPASGSTEYVYSTK